MAQQCPASNAGCSPLDQTEITWDVQLAMPYRATYQPAIKRDYDHGVCLTVIGSEEASTSQSSNGRHIAAEKLPPLSAKQLPGSCCSPSSSAHTGHSCFPDNSGGGGSITGSNGVHPRRGKSQSARSRRGIMVLGGSVMGRPSPLALSYFSLNQFTVSNFAQRPGGGSIAGRFAESRQADPEDD